MTSTHDALGQVNDFVRAVGPMLNLRKRRGHAGDRTAGAIRSSRCTASVTFKKLERLPAFRTRSSTKSAHSDVLCHTARALRSRRPENDRSPPMPWHE